MSMHSLIIFKQLFLKSPKDIKNIFSTTTSFVETKNQAIADFLMIKYPELI